MRSKKESLKRDSCVMKLWLILGKNLSTLLSGCDRFYPPCTTCATCTTCSTRTTSATCTTCATKIKSSSYTHTLMVNHDKPADISSSCVWDNRLYIRYLHTHTHRQQKSTSSTKKFPNLIPGLNTRS